MLNRRACMQSIEVPRGQNRFHARSSRQLGAAGDAARAAACCRPSRPWTSSRGSGSRASCARPSRRMPRSRCEEPGAPSRPQRGPRRHRTTLTRYLRNHPAPEKGTWWSWMEEQLALTRGRTGGAPALAAPARCALPGRRTATCRPRTRSLLELAERGRAWTGGPHAPGPGHRRSCRPSSRAASVAATLVEIAAAAAGPQAARTTSLLLPPRSRSSSSEIAQNKLPGGGARPVGCDLERLQELLSRRCAAWTRARRPGLCGGDRAGGAARGGRGAHRGRQLRGARRPARGSRASAHRRLEVRAHGR